MRYALVAAAALATSVALSTAARTDGLFTDASQWDGQWDGSTGAFIVVPRSEIPLRQNPPGFFVGSGDQIGVIEPGQGYFVLEKKVVPSLLGAQEWLKLQPVIPGDDAKVGWSYAGRVNELENFTPQGIRIFDDMLPGT
jgi:hypothetical protein